MQSNEGAIESCLPDFLALDTIQPLNAGQTFSYYLKSHKVDGTFESDCAVDGVFQDGKIALTFEFKRGAPLGIPYNIYIVLIATETKVLAWHDFTMGCSPGGAVKSLFRGEKFALPVIKDIKEGQINLRLLIWGR